MADYVTLLGAENVQRAGHEISRAAERITWAASSIVDSNDRLIRALEDHAARVEQATASKEEQHG